MNAPLQIIDVRSLPIYQMDEQRALEVLENSLFPGASFPSIKLVLGWCEARGVDPMDKPCHIVPIWDSKADRLRDVIMPSVDYYRQKAESTGDYMGLSDTEYGPDTTEQLGEVKISYPAWARIVVRRMVQGQIAEFPAKVFWKETYATKKKAVRDPNAMWQKRPYGQLEKCAEALALRRAFPKLCGGPTAEEMYGKAIDDTSGVTIDGATGQVETGSKAGVQMPKAKSESRTEAKPERKDPPPVVDDSPIKESQLKLIRAKMASAALSDIDLIAKFGQIDTLKSSQVNAILDWIKNPAPGGDDE